MTAITPSSPHAAQKTAKKVEVVLTSLELDGLLTVPDEPVGIVIFAHGSGSSRFSPRNTYVSQRLNAAGLATLLFDLLKDEEATREHVFDIGLLAERLLLAIEWLRGQSKLSSLNVGLFGSSTGAAAALVAAAKCPDVAAPTLLIVGENDRHVLDLNEHALERLTCEKRLEIVPGATHLFEEPGALDRVIDHAKRWFVKHLAAEDRLKA